MNFLKLGVTFVKSLSALFVPGKWLQDYWARQGCTIVQPLDMEVGAGTSQVSTRTPSFVSSLWAAAGNKLSGTAVIYK